jgi:hypothetical protein
MNMKQFHRFQSGLLVMLVLATGVLAFAAGRGQQPKVQVGDGHRSPVKAKVTFKTGDTKTMWITAIVGSPWNDFYFGGASPEGTTVKVWLDTLSAVKDVDVVQAGPEATFTLKNGKELRLRPSGTVKAATEDGGTEEFNLSQVKSMQFLSAVRSDKFKNLMFDNWRYSPFTGEKLPEN